MTLSYTAEQRAKIAEAEQIKRAVAKPLKAANRLEKKARQKALIQSEAPNKRDPRQVDAGFMSWLHVDLPCIGCLIEGPGPVGYATIEAAHLKMSIHAKGWKKAGLGPRTHDARCAPLCQWHHRISRNSCDVGGQANFWARMGLGDDVADFCAELFHAYRTHDDGAVVVRAWAAAGLSGRALGTEDRPSDWVRDAPKSFETPSPTKVIP